MRGRLKSAIPCKDGVAVLFEIATVPEEMESLQDKDLDITAKVHREKRSLDANGYYWSLVGKLAEVMRVSKDEMHNIELSRYGQFDFLPDGSLNWSVKPPMWDWRQSVGEHYRFSERFVKTVDKKGREHQLPIYWVIRGSHTYDTREFSILIDGVIQDAKEQGIEVLTPDEIARMMEAYDEAFKRKQISQPAHDC